MRMRFLRTARFFALYDAVTGGSAVWTETKTVAVANGVFTTALGDAAAFPASVRSDKCHSVGVKVDGDPEMAPRLSPTSVPYALALPVVTVASWTFANVTAVVLNTAGAVGQPAAFSVIMHQDGAATNRGFFHHHGIPLTGRDNAGPRRRTSSGAARRCIISATASRAGLGKRLPEFVL